MDTITDATGSVIQSMSDVHGCTSAAGGRKPGAAFDAFGNRRLANNWDYGVSQNTLATMNDYTNRGYTDQEQLDNLSLVDMNGRVYDPTVGRFISADPMVSQPFNSQGFNRYSYVNNRPLEATDPSGFDLTKLCEEFPGSLGCLSGGANSGNSSAGNNGASGGGSTPILPVPCEFPVNCPAGPPSISDILSPELDFYPPSILAAMLQSMPSPSPPETNYLGAVDVKVKPAPKPKQPPPPERVYMPIIRPQSRDPSLQLSPAQMRRLLEAEGVCSGGVMSSRSNNPSEQGNIKKSVVVGMVGGGIVGGVLAGIAVAAVPLTDGGSLLLLLGDNPLAAGAEGGLIGAVYGAGGGAVTGIAITQPMTLPCL